MCCANSFRYILHSMMESVFPEIFKKQMVLLVDSAGRFGSVSVNELLGERKMTSDENRPLALAPRCRIDGLRSL